MKPVLRVLAVLPLALPFGSALADPPGFTPPTVEIVPAPAESELRGLYVVSLTGDIAGGETARLDKALAEAKRRKQRVVALRLESPGGWTDKGEQLAAWIVRHKELRV